MEILRPITDNNDVYEDYKWYFSPGITPEVRQLTMVITVMGKPFSKTLMLGSAGKDIRYEAVWDPSSHKIGLEVFNLSSETLVARYDEKEIIIHEGTDNQVCYSKSEDRAGYIISPGDSQTNWIEFGPCKVESESELFIPVFCAEKNVRVPIQIRQK